MSCKFVPVTDKSSRCRSARSGRVELRLKYAVTSRSSGFRTANSSGNLSVVRGLACEAEREEVNLLEPNPGCRCSWLAVAGLASHTDLSVSPLQM
jgi:hypothetical protein